MWFTENPWPPMLIAGIAALVFLAMWNSNRRQLFFLLGVVFLLMTGGIYAFERAIVTDGEKLQQQVAQLCDQFRRKDPQTLDHFSEHSPEWKETCQQAMNTVEIRDDMHLTDFQTTFTNNRSRAEVHFRANATISAMGYSGYHPLRCILTFQKEGGLWKIVDVKRLDPFRGDEIGVMSRE